MDLIRVEVKNAVGVFTDPNPSDLPMNAWTNARNVKFRNGKASKSQGHDKVFPDTPANPLYLIPYLTQNTPYWFLGTDTKIYRTSGSSWQDVSRTTGGDYAASPTNSWNGGFLNGVLVMNNGVDTPQSLQPNDSDFKDLPNWPVNTKAEVIRPFKNYLVALNITKSSVNQPTTVKWSSPADPGEVPFTWDETDATNDAGENFLADTAGAIVDGVKLKDSFIIYKEDSVYAMRYIGGTFIFQFQQLFDDVGMLSTNCAAEFDGKHFVVGQGDVYVHNGVQKQSVIDGKMKDYLFNAIKNTSIRNVFVVPDYNQSEMWICYQSSDADPTANADRALIWNWKEDTWTVRDLPNVIYATHGIVDPQKDDDWDGDAQEWNLDTTVWDSSSYNPAKTRLLLLSRGALDCYVVGDSSVFDGVSFQSRLEKTDMYFEDDQKVKFVSSITPHIRGNGICQVYVGKSMIQDSPVEWFGPFNYTIGSDYKIDCRVSGRYIGVRFEFDSSGDWQFNGYTIEMTPPVGKR